MAAGGGEMTAVWSGSEDHMICDQGSGPHGVWLRLGIPWCVVRI